MKLEIRFGKNPEEYMVQVSKSSSKKIADRLGKNGYNFSYAPDTNWAEFEKSFEKIF